MQIKRSGSQAWDKSRPAFAADSCDVPAVAADLDSVGDQDRRLAVSDLWVEVLMQQKRRLSLLSRLPCLAKPSHANPRRTSPGPALPRRALPGLATPRHYFLFANAITGVFRSDAGSGISSRRRNIDSLCA